MKKILGVLALAVALCVVLVYAFVIPPIKAERRAAVVAFLQSLPGQCAAGEVEVEPLTGNIILKKVVWRGPEQSPDRYEFTAEEIALKGVNAEAAQGRGAARLLRGAVFSGLELTSHVELVQGPGASLKEHTRLAGARMGELRGDAALLLQWLRGEQPPAGRLAALFSLSLESLAVTDYSNTLDIPDLGALVFRVRASSVSDLRPLSAGKGIWEGIAASFEGREVLSLKRLTVDAVALPDFLTPLVPDEAGQEENMWQNLLAHLEKDDLAVKNLEATDLVFSPPDQGGFSARRLFFDLDLGAGDDGVSHFRQQSDELRLAPGFLAWAAPGVNSILRTFDIGLTLNSRVDLNISGPGPEWDLQIREFFLEDAAQGAIALQCSLFLDGQGEQDFFDSGLDCYLKNCQLLLTDRGAAALLLRASAPDPEGMDAQRLALMRRHIAESFEQDALNAGGSSQAALFRGLARIARAPGSLRLNFAPKEPVLLEGRPDLAEALNITVEYSP